jgi:uncharacterized coiled-coil DUF342 family protein
MSELKTVQSELKGVERSIGELEGQFKTTDKKIDGLVHRIERLHTLKRSTTDLKKADKIDRLIDTVERKLEPLRETRTSLAGQISNDKKKIELLEKSVPGIKSEKRIGIGRKIKDRIGRGITGAAAAAGSTVQRRRKKRYEHGGPICEEHKQARRRGHGSGGDTPCA